MLCASDGDDAGGKRLKPLVWLNDATKWMVVAAQTLAVFTRRDFTAPYIVIGSISVAFWAGLLKRLINQQRPDGSPFADPGMPSSHALVSTFAATAWAAHLRWRSPACAPLLLAAAVVSALRVVCGCHTWAQVGVGCALGGGAAVGWMRAAPASAGPAALAAVYAVYVGGSAVFVAKKMSRWRGPREFGDF